VTFSGTGLPGFPAWENYCGRKALKRGYPMPIVAQQNRMRAAALSQLTILEAPISRGEHTANPHPSSIKAGPPSPSKIPRLPFQNLRCRQSRHFLRSLRISRLHSGSPLSATSWLCSDQPSNQTHTVKITSNCKAHANVLDSFVD
jgi:hypothetical protein